MLNVFNWTNDIPRVATFFIERYQFHFRWSLICFRKTTKSQVRFVDVWLLFYCPCRKCILRKLLIWTLLYLSVISWHILFKKKATLNYVFYKSAPDVRICLYDMNGYNKSNVNSFCKTKVRNCGIHTEQHQIINHPLFWYSYHFDYDTSLRFHFF